MKYFILFALSIGCSSSETIEELYAECESNSKQFSLDLEEFGCELGYSQGEAMADLVTGGQSQCYDQYSNAYSEIIEEALTPNVGDSDASDVFFYDYSDCIMDGFRARYEETCQL